ncbi:MAG: class IV adenylate cyclase [Planctomycetota bacterium]
MIIEIEAKMKLGDRDTRDALVVRLHELDAKPLGQFSESNTFFDTPEGRLKATDQGLRVRVVTPNSGDPVPPPPHATITHKGPRAHGQLKSRSEHEVNVTDAKDAAELLAILGYAHVLTFEKHRTSYRLGDCVIELDTLPHIGEFVEIEGPSDDDVLAAREQLGLADLPLIKASYIALLSDHAKANDLRTNVIRFETPDASA